MKTAEDYFLPKNIITESEKAVACMLEHELPGKVAIYGDITRGQCKKRLKLRCHKTNDSIRKRGYLIDTFYD